MIAGNAGILVSRVLYVKRMGGKTFVITDAGMNDLLRPSHYSSYHHVDPVTQTRGRDTIEVEDVDQMSWRHAIQIGCAQCLAFIPGTSRAAATIIGGLFSGLSRRAEFP